MSLIVLFAARIAYAVVNFLIISIFASAILSWLVAFDVINIRNQLAAQVYRFLDAVTRPVLKPVQRIVPSLGGVDISPIIVLIVLSAANRTLIEPFAR